MEGTAPLDEVPASENESQSNEPTAEDGGQESVEGAVEEGETEAVLPENSTDEPASTAEGTAEEQPAAEDREVSEEGAVLPGETEEEVGGGDAPAEDEATVEPEASGDAEVTETAADVDGQNGQESTEPGEHVEPEESAEAGEYVEAEEGDESAEAERGEGEEGRPPEGQGDVGVSVDEGDSADMGHSSMEEGDPTAAQPSATDEPSERLPLSRTVEVDMGPEVEPVALNLTVEYDLPPRKPYHGGYRHKVTGIVYHHAGSQTEAPPKPKRAVEELVAPKFHRETQTKVAREKASQGVREFGTQMERDDVHVEARTDYYIVPRQYKDSDEWHRVRLQSTIVIQCYARGMFARSLARKCRYELAYNRSYYLEQQEQEAREAEERRNRELERRMKPRTRADFEILYNELEAWRVAETHKIEVSELSPDEKQQARYQLLLKEIKLVQTIDKLKAQASKSNNSNSISQQLTTMSKPKLWEMSDGTVKEVLTPYTSRAKELGDLYQGLTLPNLRVDERLDVLLHVKWTVKEFETKLTKEIIELIDREADLLNRGRPDKSLEGLRKRIVRAFLQFIKDPQYNPEAKILSEQFGSMGATVSTVR